MAIARQDNKNIDLNEIEVSAKTAKDAIGIGLAKLGLKKSDVNIKVLSEETKGLFSMHGSRLAKVLLKKKTKLK